MKNREYKIAFSLKFVSQNSFFHYKCIVCKHRKHTSHFAHQVFAYRQMPCAAHISFKVNFPVQRNEIFGTKTATTGNSRCRRKCQTKISRKSSRTGNGRRLGGMGNHIGWQNVPERSFGRSTHTVPSSDFALYHFFCHLPQIGVHMLILTAIWLVNGFFSQLFFCVRTGKKCESEGR